LLLTQLIKIQYISISFITDDGYRLQLALQKKSSVKFNNVLPSVNVIESLFVAKIKPIFHAVLPSFSYSTYLLAAASLVAKTTYAV